jgi:hypothetical protein
MEFVVSVFFIKPLLLVLIDTTSSNFGVYTILVELLIFERDSLMYSPLGSRSEGPWLNLLYDCSFKGHGKPLKQLKTGKNCSPVVNTPESLDAR